MLNFEDLKRTFITFAIPLLFLAPLSYYLFPYIFTTELILGITALGIGYRVLVDPLVRSWGSYIKEKVQAGLENASSRLKSYFTKAADQNDKNNERALALRLPQQSDAYPHDASILNRSWWEIAKKVPFWITLTIQATIAAFMPRRHFVRLANFLQGYGYQIGGWLELPYPAGYLDKVSYPVYFEPLQSVKDLIKILPKDVYYRFLNKRYENNESILYMAMIGWEESIDKFEALLAAVDQKDRLEFLTAIVGTEAQGKRKGPLIHKLTYPKAEEFWDIAMKMLSSSDQKKLALTKDEKGDSLFFVIIRQKFYSTKMLAKVLFPLTREERKQTMLEICLHGKSAVVELFLRDEMCYLEEVLALLPKDDWEEIFHCRPIGWEMTLGEKIMILMNATNDDDCYEKSEYLKKYNVEIPAYYLNLTAEERGKAYDQIKDGIKNVNCHSIQHFITKHGRSPIVFLGQSDPYLEKRDYLKNYQRWIHHYHPDKNNGMKSEEFSQNYPHISAARKFIKGE